jgi:hypothetical protein
MRFNLAAQKDGAQLIQTTQTYNITNMVCAKFTLFICLVNLSLTGLSQSDDVASHTRSLDFVTLASPTVTNEIALRTILRLGMKSNEITKAFGRPAEVFDVSHGTYWEYPLVPFRAEEPSMFVVGLGLTLSNGNLTRWGCSYVVATNLPVVNWTKSISTLQGRNSNALQFFTVYDHPLEHGRYIDNAQLPKLGYVSNKAEFAANNLYDVELEEQTNSDSGPQRGNVWVFRCSLRQQDAVRLEAMTSTNVLNRVLIMIGGKPVAAPRILAPIEDGRFEITCPELNMMETIKRALDDMK